MLKLKVDVDGQETVTSSLMFWSNSETTKFVREAIETSLSEIFLILDNFLEIIDVGEIDVN